MTDNLFKKGDCVVFVDGLYSGLFGKVAENQLTPDEMVAVEMAGDIEPRIQAFFAGSLKRVDKDTKDNVNHPSHYLKGGLECLDVIEAILGTEGAIAFCRGNAIKYLFRAGDKDATAQDLAKARFYVDHEIKLMNK